MAKTFVRTTGTVYGTTQPIQATPDRILGFGEINSEIYNNTKTTSTSEFEKRKYWATHKGEIQ